MSDPTARLVDDVVAGLAADPAVVAVSVVGSGAARRLTPSSDVDLFVYVDGDVSATRAALARRYASTDHPVLLGVDPFGDGDAWHHAASGVWVDLMVWTPAWAEDQLDRCLVRHEASIGYTTCFWHSIASGRAVHERDGWHARLQERAAAPYPDALVEAIVELNLPWLSGHPFSFREQVAKAVQRDDRVSVNHRLAAWLASCFDVVFALNRVLHPGEKRLVEIARAECAELPEAFDDDLRHVLSTPDPVARLDLMAERLRTLVAAR